MITISTVIFRTGALVTIAIACIAALGASSEVTQERLVKSPPIYAALGKVPQRARHKRNPLAGSPDAVAAGRKLYEQYCAQCHGIAAEGTKRGPSLRAEQVQRATPGAIFWTVTNGVVRRGMPAWSKLPEPQRWQIVSFLTDSR